MKNKKRTIISIASLLVAIILISGCSAMSPSDGMSTKSYSNMSEQMSIDNSAVSAEVYDTAPSPTSVEIPKKIIKNSWFDIQTKTFDETTATVNQKLSELKGYVQDSNSSGTVEEKNARTNLTMLIPSESFEEFNKYIRAEFSVTASGETSTDITSQYVDVDARLNALQAQEKRMLELLDKAQTVEDMVAIEGKLGELRANIESYTAQIKSYDKQISYSTVSLQIIQTESYKSKETDGFFSKLWDKIIMGFDLLVTSAGFLFVGVIVLLPYLALGLLIYHIIKKRRAKKALLNPSAPMPAPTPAPETTQPEEKSEIKPSDKE